MNLSGNLPQSAAVWCYEPLPENFAVLSATNGEHSGYVLRNVAVSNDNGIAEFAVPHRMTGNSGQWVPGTSYDGFLGRSGLGASISVPTVRLEDEINDGFDFVKLDLQGGEYDALRGLGTKLRNVKLFYVEKQLFSDGLSTSYLLEHGFITLFDRLRLSLRPGQLQVPFTLFREVGLVVDKIHLPDISGMPLII